MIRIGTSGYSYRDWVGPIYPAGTAPQDFLKFYSRLFDTTEINFTFYRMPTPKMLGRLAEKAPDDFLFSVKTPRTITHERTGNPISEMSRFRRALEPLIEANALGCVLVQFPYSFRATRANREYLERLRDELDDVPIAVEFRHVGWINEETFDQLAGLDMGFCCVDMPRLRGLIPPIARVTGPVAYVRFHGRNAQKWWRHQEAWERYDYAYSDEELSEWVPKIHRLDQEASLTLVYANNHWQGKAVKTAQRLRELLEE